MKTLELTNSKKVVLIDDEDHARCLLYRWGLSDPYGHPLQIKRTIYPQVTLSRFILNYNGPKYIDHIDQNVFNNQKCNLRVATNSQNQANTQCRSDNTSGYKGVAFHKRDKVYQAYIRVNRKQIHLGIFNDPIEAAKAYDKAAAHYFGEFAYLNFPE